ncbi:related to glycosyltransferase (PssD) [Desulfotalea psychrophila LSv54]|uniref:Related to glycosyltransferase (PssD) n=2 Tax=Desulfotalea psychrophila TaxID=84980 RepID=Q6AIB1_DESPS|nr:related to glycosyltransferase (PssD) [Desulfotalea psychrophila LSv54]
MLVSSQGGHWIQLKRLLPAFFDKELIFVSTFVNQPNLEVDNGIYFSVCDASRWAKINLIRQFLQVAIIVLKNKPDIIFSTGASIGVWAIIVGKFIGAKTIWLDSIANSNEISMSGKIVRKIVDVHLTQWEHLAGDKTKYIGTVL